jgi:ADP-ribose pyrophosphatase YjhB (NUDIX family)
VRRKGSIGGGTWALPGGSLDFGESFEECARRELLEETGLKAHNIHFLWACNTVFDESTHYVTVFMRGSLAEVRGAAKGHAATASSAACMFKPVCELPTLLRSALLCRAHYRIVRG